MDAIKTYLLSYSGMAAFGVIVLYIYTLLLSFREKLDWTRLIPSMMISLLPLYLGAKLFGVLSLICYRLQIGRPVDITVISNSGIVFYGGMLFYLLSLKLLLPKVLRYRKVSAWGLAVTGVPLFHGIARIGCYFGRCCYGVVSQSDWCAVFFEHRLPVQLMESLFNFLLFALLLILFLNRKELRGKLVYVYLFGYALFRFVIEFFRGDAVRGGIGPFSFSQYVSLLLLLYVVIKLVLHRSKNRKLSV